MDEPSQGSSNALVRQESTIQATCSGSNGHSRVGLSEHTDDACVIGSDSQANDELGRAGAVSGDLGVAGLYRDDDLGADGGAAYFVHKLGDRNGNRLADLCDLATCVSFDTSGNGIPDEWECVADFNQDGTVNTMDFIPYLNAFNTGDPAADLTGDGFVNTLDFLAFLDLHSKGCA